MGGDGGRAFQVLGGILELVVVVPQVAEELAAVFVKLKQEDGGLAQAPDKNDEVVVRRVNKA